MSSRNRLDPMDEPWIRFSESSAGPGSRTTSPGGIIPITVAVPPRRSMPNACSAVAASPIASNACSTPPPVISTIAAAGSPAEASTTSVPPQPMTATVAPGATRAVLKTAPSPVVTPQPISAARSSGISGVTLTTARSWTSISSAKEPRPANWPSPVPSAESRGLSSARTPGVWQRWGRPVRQNSHSPQNADRQVTTWSPGRTYVTSEPTASTTPADSWPMTRGVVAGYLPSMKWRSLWQRPAAAVRTSTSWGRGASTATSVISSQPGQVRRTAARTAGLCGVCASGEPAEAFGDGNPLGGRRLQVQGGPVGLGRLGGTVEPGEEVGAGDVERRPAGEPRVAGHLVEDGQAGSRALHHCHRDRPVGLDHRRGLVTAELSIEGCDLAPVGGGRVGSGRVAGGDGGLDLVRPRASGAQRLLDESDALGDRGAVPPAAVLVLQEDQAAGGVDAPWPSRVDEQQEREEAGRLGLLGQQLSQGASEPDGLLAQRGPDELLSRRRPVARREHQVDDPEDGSQPARERVGWRHPERDARLPDLAPGPDQALGHGRLGREECRCDLRRGQPTHRAQGERDPHARLQRRMTAQEDQGELVVGDRPLQRGPAPLSMLTVGRPLLLGALRPSPPPAQRAAPRGPDQPGPGVRRHSGALPLEQGCRARLLHGVLGHLDVADEARDGRHRAPPVGPEHCVEMVAQRRPSTLMTGRTSTAPARAAGMVAAQRRASSRS